MRIEWVHGLEGSPRGKKITAIRAAGHVVDADDYNGMTLLERVERGMDGGIDPITGEFIPGLSTKHESRWLVVFDRSNVKQPTDRPNIVLVAQLPVTSP